MNERCDICCRLECPTVQSRVQLELVLHRPDPVLCERKEAYYVARDACRRWLVEQPPGSLTETQREEARRQRVRDAVAKFKGKPVRRRPY